jgi:RNA polymerase sigma-B factor
MYNEHLGDFETLFKQKEVKQKINLLIVKHKAKLTPGIDEDDMRSAAYIGLMNAYQRYDAKKHESFMAYAYLVMEGKVRHLLRDNNPGLVYSRNTKEAYSKIAKLQLFDHTPEEIAEITGLSVSTVKSAVEYGISRFPLALDKPTDEMGESESTLGDTIEIHADYTRPFVDEFIASLSEREQNIVMMLLQSKTMKEIGEVTGIPASSVQKIVVKIRNKAKEYTGRTDLQVTRRKRKSA